MKPFHPSQSRRLYRAISAAAAAQARAEFAYRRADRAAAFQPEDTPERKRAQATLDAASAARHFSSMTRELADRAAWTTGESADIDTRGAEHAAQIARNHAARAVSLAARCQPTE